MCGHGGSHWRAAPPLPLRRLNRVVVVYGGCAASLQPVPGAPSKVDTVINTLRLQRCADTLAGNGVIRGVSGGEKKRVTLAEMLVNNTMRVLLMGA